MKGTKKKHFNFLIEPRLFSRLEEEARARGISYARAAEGIIRDHFDGGPSSAVESPAEGTHAHMWKVISFQERASENRRWDHCDCGARAEHRLIAGNLYIRFQWADGSTEYEINGCSCDADEFYSPAKAVAHG